MNEQWCAKKWIRRIWKNSPKKYNEPERVTKYLSIQWITVPQLTNFPPQHFPGCRFHTSSVRFSEGHCKYHKLKFQNSGNLEKSIIVIIFNSSPKLKKKMNGINWIQKISVKWSSSLIIYGFIYCRNFPTRFSPISGKFLLYACVHEWANNFGIVGCESECPEEAIFQKGQIAASGCSN